MIDQNLICEKVNFKKDKIDLMKANGEILSILDSIESQIEELFLTRNPSFKYKKEYSRELDEFINKLIEPKLITEFGSWFYYKNEKILIHFLPEDLHLEIRTARNKKIISNEDQNIFYNAHIGIAGLSIGSHATSTIIMMGGAKSINIADPDILSASNLNRVRYDFLQIGKEKSYLAASNILKVNPYSKIKIFNEGLNDKNLEEFLLSPKKINVLIEEVDNIRMKFKLRYLCKRLKIPVIMATDNSDNVIIDVERYDIDENINIFNGLVGDISEEDLDDIPDEILKSMIGSIVGIDYATDSVLESLFEVGKSIYSWPQLGSAANMSGSVLAFLARMIITDKNIKSGKYSLNIEQLFNL